MPADARLIETAGSEAADERSVSDCEIARPFYVFHDTSPSTSTKKFGDLTAVDDLSLGRGGRRDLRPGRARRRRQDHHHAAADLDHGSRRRRRLGGRASRRPRGRGGQGRDRLHEPAVRALRRPDRDGEPRLLRRHLQRAAQGPRRADRAAAGLQQPDALQAPPGGQPFRRNEAETRPGLHADPHAARCCSSTSRPTASIPSRAATSGGSSTNCCGRR